MADLQLPVEAGVLPVDFCPATEQERLEGYSEVQTVAFPESATTVIIASSVTVEDTAKLWVKIGGTENLRGVFVFQGGAWVRAQPLTPPPGTILDWFFADTEANAKTAALLLDLYDVSQTGNPFWRLADGTNGTPDLRGRVTVGAGAGVAPLTPRANADIFGVEEVALVVTEIPQHDHIVGTDDGTANTSPNKLGNSAGTTQAFDGTAATKGVHTTETGGDPADSFATVPHQNLPPSMALWKIQRTARLV